MPSTHTSLHYHVVFSTKSRMPLIKAPWTADLHSYLGGCVRGLDGVPLQVGGVADHVHLLFGLRATRALADAVREIKKSSTAWVHAGPDAHFAWQEGYGAFTVSRWDLPRISEYVREQEEHHRTRSFQEEYIAFLEEQGVTYDERYLW